MKTIYCLNFTQWKKRYVSAFLSDFTDFLFVSTSSSTFEKGFDPNSILVTWASKDQTEVNKLVKKWGGVIWYMEDGFIRSAGLGSDLTAPASLVLDKTGIYYDPNKPSDLEILLQTKQFTKAEIDRAEALKNSFLENEISKYNLGGEFKKSDLVSYKSTQQIILIPGQVEDDASIKKGCVDVNNNSDLIKFVRRQEPTAFLIYKPHPDVVSGNRKGKVNTQTTDELCNLVLEDTSITECLALVDEVHTMTSLVGFEGLMRNLKVVCYGIPFYSGWGLTTDRHTVSRRTRKITICELVAATLIDYPRYIDWQTKTLTTPEIIIKQLKEQIEKQGGKQMVKEGSVKRQFRKTKNFLIGVTSFPGK